MKDEIPELFRCMRCGKYFKKEEMFKIKKPKLPWNVEESYKLLCKKCAGRD